MIGEQCSPFRVVCRSIKYRVRLIPHFTLHNLLGLALKLFPINYKFNNKALTTTHYGPKSESWHRSNSYVLEKCPKRAPGYLYAKNQVCRCNPERAPGNLCAKNLVCRCKPAANVENHSRFHYHPHRSASGPTSRWLQNSLEAKTIFEP